MEVLVYKPGTERSLPERLEALDRLEEAIAEAGFSTSRETHEQAPGAYGVTWWEVICIYVLSHGLDSLTNHAFEQLIDKLAEVAKGWARGRFTKKLEDHPNPRPEFFAILDESGKALRAWRIDARGETDELEHSSRYPLPLHRGQASGNAESGDPGAQS